MGDAPNGLHRGPTDCGARDNIVPSREIADHRPPPARGYGARCRRGVIRAPAGCDVDVPAGESARG